MFQYSPYHVVVIGETSPFPRDELITLHKKFLEEDRSMGMKSFGKISSNKFVMVGEYGLFLYHYINKFAYFILSQ